MELMVELCKAQKERKNVVLVYTKKKLQMKEMELEEKEELAALKLEISKMDGLIRTEQQDCQLELEKKDDYIKNEQQHYQCIIVNLQEQILELIMKP